MNGELGPGERRLADYMRRVGEIQRQAEETQTRLKQLRAQVSSPDRSVSVEMAPGGRLQRLSLTPQAMQYGPNQLAALITETIRTAQTEVAEQMQETLHPLIGDSAAMDFLRDQITVAAQEDPEEPAPEAPEPESPLHPPAAAPPAPRSRRTDGSPLDDNPDDPDDDPDGPFDSVWKG
jgi:DNA-binding protein YbaB